MKVTYSILAAAVGIGFALHAPAQTHKHSPLDAPLPSARVGLPQLGLTADEVLSPMQEKALGRLIWRDLRSEPDVLTDTLITDYLQQLTGKLSKQLDLPEAIALRAFAVADPQLNAFAMPSGLMGINTGLMLSVAREGELAAVMAHEIGHVSQRHFARGLASKKSDNWIALAGFAAALIAARNNNHQSGAVIEGALAGSQALTASRQLSFSRDMEREADAVGFALMREASYDGADMVRMLRRLGASSSFSETGSGYAKSHPGTTERMANIEGRLRVGSAASASTQVAVLDFLLAQARVRALLAKSPEQIDVAHSYFTAQFDRAIAQAKTPLDGHSTFGAIAAQYGLCQLALQRKQPDNAAQHWARIVPHIKQHPWLAALAYGVNGQLDNALAAVPKDSSAAVSVVQAALHSEQVFTAAQIQTAFSILRPWLTANPSDDGAWGVLAKLHTLQQQPALALWAQAEQTAAMGVLASSINLLSDALRVGESSVPITQQNQWRQRLGDFRQIAGDEKALLDQFK